MASDAVSLIMNDHRVLESLFEQVQAGGVAGSRWSRRSRRG
jgi:hypothetical protein